MSNDHRHDDDLADALDEEAREQEERRRAPASTEDAGRLERSTGRRWWPVYVVGMVLLVAAVVVVLVWPRGDVPGTAPDGGHGSAQHGDGTSGDVGSSGSSDIDGADLLTDPWPSKAVAALERDTGLSKASRLLLTRTQVQATGPASAKSTGTTSWSDYVYVEDTAVDLGDALVAPKDDELFPLDGFDATTIPGLVTQALKGSGDATSVYVLVARDTVTDGAPVRIQVYVTSKDTTHLLTADAHGTVLSRD